MMLISLNAFAFSTYTPSHIDTLTKCGIVEDNESEELSSTITRRECLEYIIKVAGDFYGNVSDCSFENYGIKHFSDVQDFTYDCQLVISSYLSGILKGKTDKNGEIIADLDSYITWQEALTMLGRLFLSNVYSDEMISEDNDWYDFAVEAGIIRTSDLVFALKADQNNESVCKNDFLYVLNSAMHTPRYTNTYSGIKVEYLIDDFVK